MIEQLDLQELDLDSLTIQETKEVFCAFVDNSTLPLTYKEPAKSFVLRMEDNKLSELKNAVKTVLAASLKKDRMTISNALRDLGIPVFMSVIIATHIMNEIDKLELGE